MYFFWSEPAKPNGSESTHWVKRTSGCSVLPLLPVMDHLRGMTQGLHRYSNFFFGNFLIRQPAFWLCCYHCSQLVFLTLFLADSVFQGIAWEENMKSLALFYALCFLHIIFHKNRGGKIILLKSTALLNKEKE